MWVRTAGNTTTEGQFQVITYAVVEDCFWVQERVKDIAWQLRTKPDVGSRCVPDPISQEPYTQQSGIQAHVRNVACSYHVPTDLVL